MSEIFATRRFPSGAARGLGTERMQRDSRTSWKRDNIGSVTTNDRLTFTHKAPCLRTTGLIQVCLIEDRDSAMYSKSGWKSGRGLAGRGTAVDYYLPDIGIGRFDWTLVWI